MHFRTRHAPRFGALAAFAASAEVRFGHLQALAEALDASKLAAAAGVGGGGGPGGVQRLGMPAAGSASRWHDLLWQRLDGALEKARPHPTILQP